MHLSFGTRVYEYGYRIGHLTGVEIDRRSRAARNIQVTPSSAPDAPVEKRPLVDVPGDHFTGDIVLHGFPAHEATVPPSDLFVLTDSTRVARGREQIGRLAGVEVDPHSGAIVEIAGRNHWWQRPFRVAVSELDFSNPGEVRVTAASEAAQGTSSRAAH